MAEEYAEIFREEATELLEELEAALLELENDPADLQIVGRVFRAMHTIKGSGAMFGFDEIANFTHHVETVLDKVREGIIPASKELIDLTLASRDHIKSLLNSAAGEGEADHVRGDRLIAALQELLTAETASKKGKPPAVEAVTEKKTPPSLHHYRVCFRPSPAFFAEHGDAKQLLADLAELGEITVLTERAPEEAGEFEAFWDVLLTTGGELNAIRDIFIFAENTSQVTITLLGTEQDEDFPPHRKLGDILVERGDLAKADLEKTLGQQRPLGELLVDSKLVSRAKVDAALSEQQEMNKRRQEKAKATETIKVAADKLDHLINLVGEMVVTQARLTQVSSHRDDPELQEPVEEVERLISELRDCVLNVRMVPIGTTFSRFTRLVRDLSDELGKEVVMVTEGAETELDKSVIEQLGDPMVHLIRNCIDHGIEPPEERQRAGKPAQGTIKLAAVHTGAHVVITVRDDGRGLDAVRIRQKAIEKKLISAEAELSQAEIFKLIFGAGVSTAEKVTNVSGRGVGMDVVKSTIEGRLKGTVTVNSELGQGTVVAITLPLTMAIIEGLLVEVGETHFVLPLAQVEECVELTAEDIDRFHGRHLFPVREHLVPYVNLRDFYGIGGVRPLLQQMVIVTLQGERLGLVLDNVIGGLQTVIKSLGWVYRQVEGVSGATILGNGEVALIVDVANLIGQVEREEKKQGSLTTNH